MDQLTLMKKQNFYQRQSKVNIIINRTIKEPRLFIIKNDDTGSELLSEKQLSNYFREKNGKIQEKLGTNIFNYGEVKKFEMDKLIGMENSKAIAFLTKALTAKDQLSSLDFIKEIEIPRIIDTLQQSVVLLKDPPKQVFKYRCLLLHPDFNSQKRQQFENDLERYRKWKEKFENIRKGYIIQDTRSQEEIDAEKRIQQMIINKRQGKPIDFNNQNVINEEEEEAKKEDFAEENEEQEENEDDA